MTATVPQPVPAPSAGEVLHPPAEIEEVFDGAGLEQFRREGFAVARGLFSASEVEGLKAHYMRLRAEGSYAGDSAGVPREGVPDGVPDPL
ncbi:MAG TPA: hypothetical protein VH257_13750, partial [Chloroflexota bacterium]|nr:hypothetical protein [Chloroflexota bacterium]